MRKSDFILDMEAQQETKAMPASEEIINLLAQAPNVWTSNPQKKPGTGAGS